MLHLPGLLTTFGQPALLCVHHFAVAGAPMLTEYQLFGCGSMSWLCFILQLPLLLLLTVPLCTLTCITPPFLCLCYPLCLPCFLLSLASFLWPILSFKYYPRHYLLRSFISKMKFMGVWLIYSVVLVSDVQQMIQLYIHLFFSRFFFYIGYCRILSRVPCAMQ